jgi:hypothetical protein
MQPTSKLLSISATVSVAALICSFSFAIAAERGEAERGQKEQPGRADQVHRGKVDQAHPGKPNQSPVHQNDTRARLSFDSGPTPGAKPAGAISLAVGANYSSIVNSGPEGATFWFEPGVHRMASIVPKNNQSFIGAEGAILNGSQLLTSFTPSAAAWVIGGQTQEGLRNAIEQGAEGAQRAGYPETVFVDDRPLKPVDALTKVGAGTFYFDYAADTISIGDDPTGKKVEAGKVAQAFGGNASGVKIMDLTIEKYNAPTQHGTIEGAQNWTIANNEVRLNYGVGITAQSNSKIVGNHVHDNGQMGMGGGGTNLLVESNEIARNGRWSGIDVFWEGGGAKFSQSTNLTVRGNYSHDNEGFGLWTDIDNVNTLYENNLVFNNSGGGITHEISYDAIMRHNALIGNGSNSQGNGTRGNPSWMWGGQIQNQNSKNVEIYGNWIDMTDAGNGIGLIQQDRGSGKEGEYAVTDNKIHDNVVISRSGSGRVGGAADYNDAGMINGNNTWWNNKYYLQDDKGFWWSRTDNNFVAFKAAVGETGALLPVSDAPAFDANAWVPRPAPVPSPEPSPAPGGTRR